MPAERTEALAVELEPTLPQREDNWATDALARNFDFYAGYSSPRTELAWAVARQAGDIVGLAPVVRLVRRPATDTLRPAVRKWLGPVIGPLAKKTTLLMDTAFLAYDDHSPFRVAPDVAPLPIKRAITDLLKKQKKVDSLWISEPADESSWLSGVTDCQFHTLPMVHVELAGFASLRDFIESQSKKRRRNFRHEQEVFAAAGASIELHAGPLAGDARLCQELLACLSASAEHSRLVVPYNDVLTDPKAFAAQPQTALVARLGDQVIGFMSFLRDGDRLMQCHGGLDYARSHDVLAYHNLIYAAIEYAIGDGCRLLSMGPLNNETKRRAGSALRPIVSGLWNRNPVDGLIAKKFFAPNFEVYCGPVGEPDYSHAT